MTLVQEIKECIELRIRNKQNKFIIFPYGDIGMQVRNILKEAYDIDAEYIVDNKLCEYNSKIESSDIFGRINCEEYVLFLACTNSEIYTNLKQLATEYFNQESIIELNSIQHNMKRKTKVGKYSYGPLCDDPAVESIGAFCSIAKGCCVVGNAATKYISTHPFMFANNNGDDEIILPYSEYKNRPYYFEGIVPKGTVEKLKRIRIGNDVWLGKNVIITNGANIGNGVIAGAGAVITKDVPDYAVVVGVPARIIKYRFTSEQIDALNRIRWWEWSDEQIRDRYDDFFLPIDVFINKYSCN